MKLEVTVSEAKELIKQIQDQPEQLFEMIRTDVRQSVGLLYIAINKVKFNLDKLLLII